MKKVDINLTLSAVAFPKGIGGLHSSVCEVETPDGAVKVSSGYGLGNDHIYVSVNGRRVLQVGTRPLLERLVQLALDLTRSEKDDKDG